MHDTLACAHARTHFHFAHVIQYNQPAVETRDDDDDDDDGLCCSERVCVSTLAIQPRYFGIENTHTKPSSGTNRCGEQEMK